MTEINIALIIAWWVAVYHMVIAGYLVFLSERREPFIMVTALVKGLLGTLVYLVVRDPPWVVRRFEWAGDLSLTLTLIVMFVFSVIVTILIWQAFDLLPPKDRIKQLGRSVKVWWSGNYSEDEQ